MARTKVFVSYSRHDESLVRPLAGIVGIATEDAVFLDVASIRPGDRWQDDIDAALQEASVYIFCWCCKAQQSEPIGHEIAVALQGAGKRLVPVLLCSSPLPPALAPYQWIDLRGAIRHDCEHGPALAPVVAPGPRIVTAPAAKPAARWRPAQYARALGIAACLVLVVSLAVTFAPKRSAPIAPAPMTRPSAEKPETGSQSGDGVFWAIGIAAAAGGSVLAYRLARKRQHAGEADQIAAAATRYFEGLRAE